MAISFSMHDHPDSGEAVQRGLMSPHQDPAGLGKGAVGRCGAQAV